MFIHLFLWLLLVLFSCKKDADSQLPEVMLLSPVKNTGCNVFDTLFVAGSAGDENKLVSLDIVLVDKDMTPVLNVLSVEVTSNYMTFKKNYVIYDIHLPSSVYYIKATAFDGINQNSVYAKVNINEAKKIKKSIYVLTAGNGKANMYSMDSVPGLSYRFSVPGDFSESAISSWYQQLYIAGKYTGSFNVVSLQDYSVMWSILPLVNPNPYFTSVYTDEKFSYVSFFDGVVSSFDYRGQQTRLFLSMTENAHPYKCIKLKEFLVMEELDITSTKRKLVSFYLSTGKFRQEWPLVQEVKAFFAKDENSVFVFGNEQGQGRIEIYDALNNYTWNPYSNFPAGKILAVAQVDELTYLIAHENNTLYKYQYAGSGLLALLPGVRADYLVFDKLNSEIITAQNTQVKTYSFPAVNLLRTEIAADSVLAVHVLYNK